MTALRAGFGLVVFLAICFGAAGLGSALTGPAIASWYAALQKPSWTPPNWLFGPVWSLLYLMMALAAWLVWRRVGIAAAAAPLALFGLQLAFNVAWSGLFFALRMPGAAFAEILVLWAFILATLIAFWRVSPGAGILMAPYLAWVTLAAALNFAVWTMNRGPA
jgi:tryptophan-rich sensory protein